MKAFNIFIDENLPSQIARGLHLLQQPQNSKDDMQIAVIAIKDHFGQGTQDEEWIPKIGKMNGIVITQDFHIQSLKHQRELYKQSGVGILFFNPPSKTGYAYWEMVKQIIKRWEEIKVIVKRNKPPFAFRCSPRGEFEKMD